MGRSLFAAQVTDYSISDQQFVTNLYEGFMQRGPDAGGLDFWTSIASGGPANRQNVLNAFAPCGPARELAGTLYREEFWLVSDRLGTPRMIVDKSGSLASVRRHDYLPFGEEVYAGTGGRTTGQGYMGDSTRQKFTGYEYDAETGLNFAQARYQSSVQGRFTSVDPLGASANVATPQSLNRYSYVQNNPTNATDPTGMIMYDASMGWGDVAGMWAGGGNSSFGGPFETGRDIIGNGMNGFADRSDDNANSGNTAENGGEHGDPGPTSEAPAHEDAQYPALSDSNSDCSISVEVVGPQTISHATDHGTAQEIGFAFNVSGQVNSGRIGRVGDPAAATAEVKGDLHNGGKWVVGQWLYPLDRSTTFANGSSQRPNPNSPNGKLSDDSPRPWSRTIHRKTFRWQDAPGWISHPESRLAAGHFSANFLVYAQNGLKRCAVRFNIEGTFANGRFNGSIGPPR
jgi:RHS repeat-associated protein